MSSRKALRFGMFMPPLHRPGTNPDVAFENNLTLLEHLDRLGFDEAWIGEHHSGGVELIDSPEIFIAIAAQRTKHIKLGTGVTSLPYHHPLTVAQRIVQLDYMTRGRIMFGAGPGQLISDASMFGIESRDLRPRLNESLDVVMRLFNGETVTKVGAGFTCDNAKLHLLPYSNFDKVVTSAITPSGPKLAGTHGIGMLTLTATNQQALDVLASQWDIATETAAANGKTVNRSDWRMAGIMHLAATAEEARRDVHFGIESLFKYLRHIVPAAMPPETKTTNELIDIINETGLGVIGTPEDAVRAIKRLQEKSGGFGSFLVQGGDFASFDATLRSYRLFAEEVIPHFTGLADSTKASFEEFVESTTHVAKVQEGLTAAFEQYEKEKATVGG